MKRRDMGRWFARHATAFALIVPIATGCASYSMCPSPPSSPNPPPSACRVDGCTLAPNLDFVDCCNAHDESYWLGGPSARRLDTDRTLRECITQHGHPGLSNVYYVGVRLAGPAWLPTPWRWGFGWPYLHGQHETAPPSASTN
jgi:hypothetical protein